MHTVSPGIFALAIVALVIIWIVLPAEVRLPLAILLVISALMWGGNGAEIISSLTQKLQGG